MANIETAVPFGPQSPSNAASLTKQFTAVAVLMLNERGMLDLNAAIRSVLA
jgi:CubicO group peptidase (beta-lactamase class C family)